MNEPTEHTEASTLGHEIIPGLTAKTQVQSDALQAKQGLTYLGTPWPKGIKDTAAAQNRFAAMVKVGTARETALRMAIDAQLGQEIHDARKAKEKADAEAASAKKPAAKAAAAKAGAAKAS